MKIVSATHLVLYCRVQTKPSMVLLKIWIIIGTQEEKSQHKKFVQNSTEKYNNMVAVK